ncbi:F-box/kelch-repeat protein At3g23880 [Medicago truncatula]|uniref:F-box protein interaction domain protein n=2 Tax=Medicago truncatula TaxID=3880 RepID=G7IX96_MEDTR|nr:F-box/kelch-repeat protein At3g23880 [Medicago truncatula]AES69872.1 F-box protein interaction domain protein [Medicago truncatula]
MAETSTAIDKQLTLTSPPQPILPLDLIIEILCRLPVKLLLQLRCVSKLWNSFITDRKFANKHLRMSTTHRIQGVTYSLFSYNSMLTSYQLNCLFTRRVTTNVTKLKYRFNNCNKPNIVGSCNGFLCVAFSNYSIVLWNPSINKFKELPLIQKSQGITNLTFSFGYDSLTDNYKVIVVLQYTDVKVHTLGTHFWKTIQEFPFGVMPVEKSGKFVSGRINWLASTDLRLQSPRFIVSFDLRKESYEKVLPPDGVDVCNLSLSVLRDCLSIFAGHHDIWVMKEYGIQESWTKLFTISNMPSPNSSVSFTKAAYIFEDDQVLLESEGNLNFVIYDSKNGTFRFPSFQIIAPDVCVESLISPCF